uniref:hypothetical protein n=1 Tax=Bifidobacterium adolescentis TaxID=1680 RepID=UPI003FEEDC25
MPDFDAIHTPILLPLPNHVKSMFFGHSTSACEPARLLESYDLRRPDPDREALLNRHARMLTELTFVTDGRFVKAAKKFGDILMEAAI